jgi:hypothetical protein
LAEPWSTGSVPPAPVIFRGRTQKLAFFYENVEHALPKENSYVFLPPLYLRTSSTECKNASYQLVALESG